MPRPSKARLAQPQAARRKRIPIRPGSLLVKPESRILIDVVKGRDAGWVGQYDGLSEESDNEEYTESDSESDISSDESEQEQEEVKSAGLTGSEAAGDVVLLATGFLKDIESKSVFDLLDMYYEDDNDAGEIEKERKTKYGGGSKATSYRNKKEAWERAKEASTSYSIRGSFERQQLLGISMKSKDTDTTLEQELDAEPAESFSNYFFDSGRQWSLQDIQRACEAPDEMQVRIRDESLRELHFLLQHKTPQKKHFGRQEPNQVTYRCYEMVRSFMWAQVLDPGRIRRELASEVTKSYFRGAYSGRQIVKWENAWIASHKIPGSSQGVHRHYGLSTLLYDEDILLVAHEYIQKAGTTITGRGLSRTIQKYLESEEGKASSASKINSLSSFDEVEAMIHKTGIRDAGYGSDIEQN
ncbi:hypothetical protein HOY80DRAFT_1083784 [Tuber brumale]|nr:hypothetical protein HOY80DRAFT_1083784 [Tuber brumale]